jgi:hypothetical protein
VSLVTRCGDGAELKVVVASSASGFGRESNIRGAFVDGDGRGPLNAIATQ